MWANLDKELSERKEEGYTMQRKIIGTGIGIAAGLSLGANIGTGIGIATGGWPLAGTVPLGIIAGAACGLLGSARLGNRVGKKLDYLKAYRDALL